MVARYCLGTKNSNERVQQVGLGAHHAPARSIGESFMKSVFRIVLAVAIFCGVATPQTALALCVDTCTDCTVTTTDALAVLNTSVGLNPVDCSATTTTSTTSTTLPMGSDCGTGAPQACVVTVDSPAGMFGDLQSAIDSSNDAATITVEGDCLGSVDVTNRNTLIIQGIAPAGGACPQAELTPGSLPSTVHADDGPGILLDDSANIVIRYLNVVDGNGEGVKLRSTNTSVVQCSCFARNAQAGISVDGGEQNTMKDNLVLANNEEGIRVDESNFNRVLSNQTIGNAFDGIHMSSSEDNSVALNVVTSNGDDGIGLSSADGNVVLLNETLGNGEPGSNDSGINLSDSDDNRVAGNIILNNADGEDGFATCSGTSNNNFGSDIPSDCD
jgi:parallel beta-helix repeat protein